MIIEEAVDETGHKYIVMSKNSHGAYVQVLFANNYVLLEDGTACIDLPLIQLHSDSTLVPIVLENDKIIKVTVKGNYIKVPIYA
jgi:hypothetical protein